MVEDEFRRCIEKRGLNNCTVGSIFLAVLPLIKDEILLDVLRPVISGIGGSLCSHFYCRSFRVVLGEKIKAKSLVAVSLLIELTGQVGNIKRKGK